MKNLRLFSVIVETNLKQHVKMQKLKKDMDKTVPIVFTIFDEALV